IGTGGMAIVYRARDERLQRQVALKLMAPGKSADESFRLRFIQESRAAAAVDDPHIIPVYEAGEATGVLYIAMRYVAGGDVQGLLERERQLPAAQVAAIVSAVASALDSAHAAGLVHRDVKPANMLLDSSPGRPDHVYLSDFGLSKGSLSSAGVTSSGQFLGTPNYTAPEQIQGQQVSGQTDQYALACTAFELLCGEPVFPRDQGVAIIYAHLSQPPRSLLSQRPDLLPATDAVLARALAKAPQDRFGSCQEFAEALRASLGVAPVVATPLAAQAPSWPGAGATAQLGGSYPGAGSISGPRAMTGHGRAAAMPSPGPGTMGWATGSASPGPGTVPPSRPPAPWQATTQVPDRPVSRRKLLWAAAAIPVAAVAGAVAWEASRPGEAATAGRKPAAARVTPTHDPDPRWQAHVPFGHGAVLAAAGGLVIVAGGLGGPHGNQVRALDARTGQPAWRHTGSGVIDQVAATDQAVYLATDPVSAVRTSDGSQLWTSPHTALYGPVESGGTVYVAEGTLYALRAQDGGLRWQYPADVTSHPVVANGMLYTLGVRNGSGGTRTVLHAIRASDGAHQWDTPAPPGGVLATDGQVVCAVEGEEVGEPGRLWVWRASDGKPLWHGPKGTDYGIPALDGGVLYVVRADGTLFAYRAARGTPLWTAPSEVAIAPAVSAGVVYASDDFGRLVARRAADGKVTWTVPHRFTEGPLVAGQTIIVTNGRAVLGIPV
ncbi:MAG TPA: PQQ-binding-like beta-propeller repeat protein, partial [Streptosporangiaceae bacterium]|nr:PQQ-binding-like beta-propeller repeat protein [Streptosporangiaceae bacterium]